MAGRTGRTPPAHAVLNIHGAPQPVTGSRRSEVRPSTPRRRALTRIVAAHTQACILWLCRACRVTNIQADSFWAIPIPACLRNHLKEIQCPDKKKTRDGRGLLKTKTAGAATGHPHTGMTSNRLQGFSCNGILLPDPNHSCSDNPKNIHALSPAVCPLFLVLDCLAPILPTHFFCGPSDSGVRPCLCSQLFEGNPM